MRALIRQLKDEDAELRWDAAWDLWGIGPAAKEAVFPLVEALGDPDARVHEWAVEALRRIGSAAVPALTQALKHEDGKVRERAARALGEIGPAAKAAAPVLVEALKDEDREVRSEAAYALGGIDPAPLQAALPRFGYVSVGRIAYADFSGGLTGFEPGTGYTVTIPPLLFVGVVGSVGACCRNVAALFREDFDDMGYPGYEGIGDHWRNGCTCGVTKPSAPVSAARAEPDVPAESPVWEASVDLTFSHSRHEDRTYGGSLTHNSILLEIRAAARTRHVRGYLSTGFGSHSFGGGSARPEIKAGLGPYVGLGVEALAGRHLALGVDGKWLFLDFKRVRVTARQVAVRATAYWYW